MSATILHIHVLHTHCVAIQLVIIHAPATLDFIRLERFVKVSFKIENGTSNSFADDNECIMNTHTCNMNGFCNNTEGSFNCTCSIGYSGDGINCTGIFVGFT